MNIHKTVKIAVVIPKYGLVGGGERFVRELTERIAADHRYDVHVFANKWSSQCDHITFHKIPIITFPRFLTTISFAWFANHKIAKMNFDIIHTHDRIFNADLFTMHGVPHRFWVKKVRRKNMSLFDYGTSWVEKSLIRKGNCRVFLPVSNLAKDKFIQEFGVDPGKVQVVHPGVDIGRFDTLDRKSCRDEIRAHFKIDEADTVLLFVGMNFELKGLGNLIAAVGVIKSKQLPDRLKLLVVGKGDRKKYHRLAEKAGIKNDVIFAGVWAEHIEHIYMASDIFAMPSGFDTFGMVVLEAMSASLPVIISDTVGAMDLVKEGINGFVVEKNDIGSMSSKIEFMLDKEKRKNLAKEAHKTAAKNTWDLMAERIIRIYEKFTGV